MPDFSRLSKRFQTGKANLDDVVRAYQAVQALPLVVEVLEKLGGEDREESLAALLDETYLAKLHVSNERCFHRSLGDFWSALILVFRPHRRTSRISRN